MTSQISVIGLNQLGISMGLALKKSEKDLVLIGSDPEIEVEHKAAKLNAFDRTQHNLVDAVSEADLVVLNTPVDSLKEMIQAVAVNLKPGAVVLVTAPLHVQTLKWAAEFLPKDRHLLVFTPSVNPAFLSQAGDSPNAPSAELFHKGTIAVSSAIDEDAQAIQLALDLAGLLDANPVIYDPYEADGVLSWARLLPYLNAVVVYRAASSQPGWKEAQKLANPEFFSSTWPLTRPAEEEVLGETLLSNTENGVRMVDALIAELQTLRGVISGQDSQALRTFLEAPVEQRLRWLQARETGVWEKRDTLPTPTGFTLKSMFGLGKSANDPQKR